MKISILYGALRSGTTLLRLMLQGHPRLWVPGESDFLFDHLQERDDGFVLDRAGLEQDRIRRNHLSELPTSELAVECVREMVTALADGHEHITLVLHRGVARAARVFPEAPVIHLIRDPRDVARSCVGMGWAGVAYRGVEGWIDTEREWLATAPKIPAEQRLDVRYEDLIAAPDQHLTEVAALLGVEYHEGFHAYPATSTYSAVDASLAYQWRRKMSPREAQLIAGRAGDLLTACGYEHSEGGAAMPNVLERIGLTYRDFVGRWAWRFRRLGVVDPLVSAVCRRLGMPGLAGAANRRIQDRVNQLRR
jgi:hypothetical protein